MDDILKYSWDINTITNNYKTHSLERGNKAIKVAVIDSGVDITHPGLKNNVILKKNFVETEEPFDFTGHGTMVCGQIVGDDIIKGIVPNCQVDVIKVLDKNNSCSFQSLISALEYVYKNQYNIVNLSLGLSIKNKTINELEYPLFLLKKLYDNGTICVNSVGYLESLKEHFPSLSPYTFTVQSLNRNNEIVNNNLSGDYCVPSGDYFNPNLSNSDDYDEYVTVFFPINKSKYL
ncbi:TPA: S8 family serine peptidase, partial [Staphylococcus aureus]|nr:S8 family serine peptidase [Staphylococcus aureus]